MPAVQAPAKVLVTGASGFLAIHIIQSYLKHGFHVRGTVRSTSKGEYLKNVFNDTKFEYVIVADMQAEDAFDKAVEGVQAIAHTAAPVSIPAGDPEITAIRPSVQGAIHILESAKRYGTEVQRIVITSSSVAICHPLVEAHYNENQWNDDAVDLVKQKGEAAGGSPIYCASKTIAERAVWAWKSKNEDIKFDITTLCPPFIFGALLQDISKRSEINVSMDFLVSNVENEASGDELTGVAAFYADARDISDIHVFATQAEKAGNKRLLTGAGPFAWQDVYDSIQEAPAVRSGPIGASPGASKGRHWDTSYGQERLADVLGKPVNELFRPFSVTIRDTISSVESKGW